MDFAQTEPFGSKAMYYGHAITTSMIFNAHKGKNQTASKPSDFMPIFKRKEPQSTNEMIGMAATITLAFGGEDKRK